MSQLETVQYFQFDNEGNMYIFAPGTGCTGESKLVKPGDELIFFSSSPSNGQAEGVVTEEATAEQGFTQTWQQPLIQGTSAGGEPCSTEP